MRKIEKEMNKTVRLLLTNSGNLSRDLGNTRIERDDKTGAVKVYLHANLIAVISHAERGYWVRVDSCGWRTPTTKSRLNALLFEFGLAKSVYQKKGAWYVALHTSGMFCDFVDGMVL